MNKEELYNQIEEFWNTLTNPSDRTSKTYGQAYLYVDNENAIDKARFVGYLIDNGYLAKDYKTILDLTFGSGNLTSHIIFDNDIKYNKLYLNDINTLNTNQDIKNYIDNCQIIQNNILESFSFEELSADLIIINPQIGGNYIDGDILGQKQSSESQRDVLDKLQETIKNYIDAGSTVLFYGKKKDFDSIFNTENYLHYISNMQQIFVVSNSITETVCFKRDEDSFATVECDATDDSDDEKIESFDAIIENLDDYNSQEKTIENKVIFSSDNAKKSEVEWDEFPYRNILFKGVPGTGKSRAIDKITTDQLGLEKNDKNVLRINIHSASSNSDLMQGIGISSNNGEIQYSEKQGLILDIIKRATLHPNQPFVLILEEIQENSLNELIGDLIYLIEDEKRARLKVKVDDQEYDSYEALINKLIDEDSGIPYVEVPYLVNDSTDYKKMIMPSNLFIFCTSNYRDDKKIIEDNLLRRFEVIEIYPNKDVASEYAQEFLESLNISILTTMQENHEIHPDRYMIGHAIWKDVEDDKSFYRAFLKLITEFKDIREIEFDIFKKIIKNTKFPDNIEVDMDTKESYFDLIQDIQKKIDYGFLD